MPVERRGQVTGIEVVRVNGKPEELDGLDGRRQLLVGGTSRISREAYVRMYWFSVKMRVNLTE
jgi:hypothetical protein